MVHVKQLIKHSQSLCGCAWMRQEGYSNQLNLPTAAPSSRMPPLPPVCFCRCIPDHTQWCNGMQRHVCCVLFVFQWCHSYAYSTRCLFSFPRARAVCFLSSPRPLCNESATGVSHEGLPDVTATVTSSNPQTLHLTCKNSYCIRDSSSSTQFLSVKTCVDQKRLVFDILLKFVTSTITV